MLKAILLVAIVAGVAQLGLTQTTATKAPTHAPTNLPTHAPTNPPTKSPTHPPTHAPTHPPTPRPSTVPPTIPPTKHVDPTHPPTHAPTTPPRPQTTQTRPPTTHPATHPTQPPTTKKPYVPKPDPKLSHLAQEVSNLTTEVRLADKAFEVNVAQGNTFELTKLLDVIKKIKIQIEYDMVDIRMEIASSTGQLQTYGRRLFLEFLRLQVETYDRFLSAVSATILSSFNDNNRFPSYVISETLAIAADLMGTKLGKITEDIMEIDRTIEEFHENNPTKAKIDEPVKQKIVRDLEEIFQLAIQGHNEISSDYYGEVERIREEGKELNIWQKYEYELFIDLLNFLKDYTRHFEDLFNRISF